MSRPDASVRPDGGGEQVVLLRDQARALYAYRSVKAVPEGRRERQEYETAVNVLCMTLLQGGLAMAMASIERLGGSLLLRHLAGAGVPGLEGATGESLPGRVRELAVDEYMIASRELREVASWLKRAAQATFGGE